MPDISHSVDEVQFTITFRVTSPYRPAKLHGPPENCYPAEPAEYEITKVTIDSPGKGDVELPEALWETFGISVDDLDIQMDEETAAEEQREKDDADDAKFEARRDRELDPPEWRDEE